MRLSFKKKSVTGAKQRSEKCVKLCIDIRIKYIVKLNNIGKKLTALFIEKKKDKTFLV